MLVRRMRGKIAYYVFPALEAAGARHAIATRLGGVSVGPHAQLNVGYSVGDIAEHVQENRRLLFLTVDAEAEDVVTSHQVHSTQVAHVREADRGRGALDPANTIPATDALVTRAAGVFLFQRFADCVPILLCDPTRRQVAVAHAGWKGTIGQVVTEAVEAMGGDPAHIMAAIGPCIGPCHYEIQEDVARQVRASLPFWRAVLRERDGNLALDLVEANRLLLLAAGLAERNVEAARVCTACHTDEFYSHRAEKGATGRFGVLIGWTGEGRVHG